MALTNLCSLFQKTVNPIGKPPVLTKTGSVASAPSGRKTTIGANPRTDPTSLNNAGFVAYMELLKSIASSAGQGSKRGSPTEKNAVLNDEMLNRMTECFRNILLAKDLPNYEKLNLEAKVGLSGPLNRTLYGRYLNDPTRIEYLQDMARRLNVRLPSDHDVELVRQVWERNADQIRLIYSFYGTTVEHRRLGNGPLKLLMSLENCKEMLQDFQLLPQLIDVQNLCRLFRSCKLWEWEVADMIIRANDRRNEDHDNRVS